MIAGLSVGQRQRQTPLSQSFSLFSLFYVSLNKEFPAKITGNYGSTYLSTRHRLAPGAGRKQELKFVDLDLETLIGAQVQLLISHRDGKEENEGQTVAVFTGVPKPEVWRVPVGYVRVRERQGVNCSYVWMVGG